MKRLTILIVILTCFTALCLGQRRVRAVTQKIIQLTRPKTVGKVSFEEALSKQQDVLMFTGQTFERILIGQLAWAAQGVRELQTNLQTVSSTEAASPIQLYLATDEGVFAYQPDENSMEQTIYQDVRNALSTAAAPMADSIASAGCVFIITVPTRRLSTQRRASSRTSMYLQAGHMAQNIQLQAICMDLGSVTISDFDTRNVNTACRLPRNVEPLYIICVGYPASQTVSEAGDDQTGETIKRAALIVPSRNFRDEEFFETLKALDAASIQRVVASKRIGIIRGFLGGGFEANMLVNQLKVDDYDAFIFIGGAGAVEYVNDPVALNLIREAVEKRKIVAATSTAPSILANAGVLKGVKVTAFLSERDILLQSGAVYMGTPVEQDMKIITCSGPDAVVPFTRALTDAITGR